MPRCPECRRTVMFYDHPSLRQSDTDAVADRVVFSWFSAAGEFRLPVARYRCPVCSEFRMRFTEEAAWD